MSGECCAIAAAASCVVTAAVAAGERTRTRRTSLLSIGCPALMYAAAAAAADANAHIHTGKQAAGILGKLVVRASALTHKHTYANE